MISSLSAEEYFASLFPINTQRDDFLQSLHSIFFSNKPQSEKYIYYWLGSGSNGKSSLLHLLHAAFDNKCIQGGNFKDIGEVINTDTQLISSHETSNFDIHTIKSLMSDAPFTFNKRYQGSLTINPKCSIVFVVNDMTDPNNVINRASTKDDYSFSCRFKTFCFSQQFQGGQLDIMHLANDQTFLYDVREYIKNYISY